MFYASQSHDALAFRGASAEGLQRLVCRVHVGVEGSLPTRFLGRCSRRRWGIQIGVCIKYTGARRLWGQDHG